jgi:hypothetical protein
MATMGCDCSSPGGARVRLAERSSTKFGPLSPTATPALLFASRKGRPIKSDRRGRGCLPTSSRILRRHHRSELLFPTRHGSSPFSSSPRAARRGAAASWSLTIRYCRWDRGRWWPPRPAAHVSFFTGCRLLPCAADADADAVPDPSSGRTDRDASSSASPRYVPRLLQVGPPSGGFASISGPVRFRLRFLANFAHRPSRSDEFTRTVARQSLLATRFDLRHASLLVPSFQDIFPSKQTASSTSDI